MTRAQKARTEALGMLVELYVPESMDYELRERPAAEIAGNIRKLAALGRTARWADAVEGWAVMVERGPHAAAVVTPEADPRWYLRWAFLQGAIYAGHAA